MFENLFFFELKKRYYVFYIGKNVYKEIYFIAKIRDDKIYIQVCKELSKESDRKLMKIKDHYHKFIVALIDEMVLN